MKLTNLPSKTKKYIIDSYDNGSSSVKLSKEFSVAPNNIIAFLRKNGVEIRKPKYRKYNHNFYSWPFDTENGQYWLGFLLADGYINKKKNVLRLELSYKDINHIIKFRNFISNDVPIMTEKNRISPLNKIVRIEVCSVSICRSLLDHGFNDFKIDGDSSILHNSNHLIRGFFDGDGSIGNREFNIVTPHLEIANKLSNIFENIGIEVKTHEDKRSLRKRKTKNGHKLKNIFRCRTTDKIKIQTIYEWLYKNSTIYLDRKKIKMEGRIWTQ